MEASPSRGQALLAEFARFVKAEHLEAFTADNIHWNYELDSPLMAIVSHLSEPEVIAMSIPGSEKFLTDLEEGRAIEAQREALRLWEADELPGISRDAVEPADLVRVTAAQRRALYTYIGKFTQDPAAIMDLVTSLDAYYTQAQDETLAVFTRLREAAAQKTIRLEMEKEAAEAQAEELTAANEELTSLYEELQAANEVTTAQAEELTSQQEELNQLYEELQHYNEKLEAQVAERTGELAAERNFVAGLLDNLPSAFAYVDRELRYRHVNERYAAMLHRRVEDLLGRTVHEVMGELEPRLIPVLEQVLKTGEGFEASGSPYTYTDAGGTRETYWDTRIVRVDDERGAPMGVMTLALEATERVQLEQQSRARKQALAEANARLKEADRYKDEFLSVISHELRTPLNFITGFASLLEDEVAGPLNETQHSYVARILSGTDRMLYLVNDLLDFARLKAGQFNLEPQPTAFGPLVEDVLSVMSPLADQKAIRLAAEVEVPGTPVLDGPRILQVLTNLVSNGVKFTPAGGEVKVNACVRDGQVHVEVKDTGSGIAEDDIPKLFERFRQLNMSKTREVGGAGLGLAISKSIVEAHGGAIGVRSKPGDGSTFWFSLPLSGPVERPQEAVAR